MEEKLLRDLACDLKLEFTDEEAADLQASFPELEQTMALFETVDTNGIEPMISCSQTGGHALREDSPGASLSQAEVLQNAPEKDDSFILVRRVVK